MKLRRTGRHFIVYIFGLVTLGAAIHPLRAHAGETQRGLASWHEPGGRDGRTASKHRWISTEMVTAHRTLPLGSRVRVVNLLNGRAAVVRITDRGPYAHGRIIDVSRCAARQLGLLESGIVRVSLEPLPPDADAPL